MSVAKGFFFDLDGTLVDTHRANFQAYKKALADCGVQLTFAQFKQTIGRQAQDFLQELAPQLHSKDYIAIAQRKAEYYKAAASLSRLNTGLAGFLHTMKAFHYMALVTTAKRQNAEVILRHHMLADAFDTIITAEDVTHSKPSPEAYLLALRRSGLKANEVITFEDSDSGKQAAIAAGITVVMVRDFVV